MRLGIEGLLPIQRAEKRPELHGQQDAEGGDGGKLAKLLVNVTVEGTLGPIHLVMSQENTVADLVRTAVEEYANEGRRPLLLSTDPKGFELHYSQYSLEGLDPQEKLINLGSRNFFLCSQIPKG